MPETDAQEQQDVQPEESIHQAIESGTDVISIVEVATVDAEDEVEAATGVSAAVVRTPATVIDEISSGATLPLALSNAGTAVREVLDSAAGRVRTAVGAYVGARATLPNAVVLGAADVAESVVRAQGAVAATVISGAFTVATVAARGEDVWEAFADERREVRAQAVVARGDIVHTWRQAREHIESARDIG